MNKVVWRAKMPHHIFELVEAAGRAVFYVVHEWGPTSFTLRDQASRKYKVNIGAEVSCSCSPTRADHCVHSLFLLLRMFKVDKRNPLVWQAGYNDSELKSLVEGKHPAVRSRREKQKKEPKESKEEELVKRRQLAEGQDCCICQQAMGQSSALTFCGQGCGNNFHVKCLKIWGQHKVETKSPITCPMCRCKWPSLLSDLAHASREFARNNPSAACSACAGSQPAFYCLLCKDYVLCYPCYSSMTHPTHTRWLTRPPGGDLRPAPPRKPVNDKQRLIQQFRSGSFQDYLVESLPTASKHITAMLDKEQRTGSMPKPLALVCSYCGGDRLLTLRKLGCGHFLDQVCLRECIQRQEYQCPAQRCKAIFFKGLAGLKKTKPLKQDSEQGCKLSDLLGPTVITKKDLVAVAQAQSRRLRLREEQLQGQTAQIQQLRTQLSSLQQIQGQQELHSPSMVSSRGPKRRSLLRRPSTSNSLLQSQQTIASPRLPNQVRPGVHLPPRSQLTRSGLGQAQQKTKPQASAQSREQSPRRQLKAPLSIQMTQALVALAIPEQALTVPVRTPIPEREEDQPALPRDPSQQRRNGERQRRARQREERLNKLRSKRGNGQKKMDELFSQARQLKSQLKDLFS